MPHNPFKPPLTKDIVVPRQKLGAHKWDIGGRDLFVAFNEPAFGNGKLELAEVTYENGEGLDFYDKYDKLKPDMEYIYEFIPKDRYQAFWTDYKDRYFDLKQRYREAYKLAEDF